MQLATDSECSASVTPAGAIDADITLLLREWQQGDLQASDELFETLMPELRRIAKACFGRERVNNTMQPTALINEAFLRLAAAHGIDWRDRGHFLALMARVMRRHLIDRSRSRPEARFLPLEGLPEGIMTSKTPLEIATIIDRLIAQLEAHSPRQSWTVELKFFLGLTDTEGAEALGISLHTFQREWYRARKWLFTQLAA